MTFREKIIKNKFTVTAELEAPKAVSCEGILKNIAEVKAKVDAFNVTDMQASKMRISPWALCILLKQKGLEPIMQLTARDRNVIALQGDLLGAYSFGVDNLLLLTGDNPEWGDHPRAKGVFEFDSTGLIQLAGALNSGRDWAGNPIGGKTDFYRGAALNPLSPDLNRELKKMDAKIKAGVSFFQTQPVFVVDKFAEFLKKYRPPLPVIAGITLLKSERMARYLNKNIPGVDVPSSYIKRIKDPESKRDEVVSIAKSILKDLRGLCAGVHFMPFGWFKELNRVLTDE